MDGFASEDTRRIVEEEIGKRSMSEDRIDEILENVEDMQVRLAEDPIVQGPSFLIRQLAQVRNYMSEAQTYREDIQNHITRLKRKLNDLQSEYELRYNSLRVNSPKIADFGAARDRDAACEHELQDLKVQINNIESEISELKSVKEAVDNRFENLKQTGWDIRKQRELIQDEFELTGRDWGDEPVESLEDEITEEDVSLDEDNLKTNAALDIQREEESGEDPDDEVGMEDLMEGVDTSTNGDKVKGPELNGSLTEDNNPDESEGDFGDDAISEALEDVEVDF